MPKTTTTSVSATYERKKAKALQRELDTSARVRDIGPPPKCVNTRLRKQLETDSVKFLQRMFPELFRWGFSPSQIEAIKSLDDIIENGGLSAIAAPRGTGKTQRVIRQALKAVLSGKRKYVCIVAATDGAAKKIIEALRKIVCFHKGMQALFPAELHGFSRLKGSNRLAGGQLCQGEPTEIGIAKDRIVFPMINGSKCSGSIIGSCGITGNVRGQFHTLSDGHVLRPDLVIVDDPQTRESANSLVQTNNRMELIEGDVLGLSGPDTSIACAVLCTVIKSGDLSERILNERKWRGIRTKTLLQWPTHMKAWEEYFDEYNERPYNINAYYKTHQKLLEEGCVVEWPERVEAGRVNAIQSAMHIWNKMGPVAFAAECQNEPLVTADDAASIQSTEQILTRLNPLPRNRVPLKAEHLTAHIDVQGKMLFWMVCWWAKDFTGGILDYGGFPDQKRHYYTLDDAQVNLINATGRKALMAAIRAGLDQLTETLATRKWTRDGGSQVGVDRIGIDSKWGDSTDTVFDACRESRFSQMLRPMQGASMKVTSKPMSQWKTAEGEFNGAHWFRKANKRGIRYLLVDTGYWKSFVHNGLSLHSEDEHSISLCQAKAHEHRMLAEHLTAETRSRPKTEDGRSIDVWTLTPGRDNHHFDNLVGCAVIASELGCSLNASARKAAIPQRTGPIRAKYY